MREEARFLRFEQLDRHPQVTTNLLIGDTVVDEAREQNLQIKPNAGHAGSRGSHAGETDRDVRMTQAMTHTMTQNLIGRRRKSWPHKGLAQKTQMTQKNRLLEATREKLRPGAIEVALPDGLLVYGVVLSDHLKSADRRARSAEYIGLAPPEVLAEVRAKLKPLLGT